MAFLEKVDAATRPGGERGAVGALLRQHASHISTWRAWRDRINRGQVTPKKSAGVGRAEHDKLVRENARLQKKLDQAQILIELQKKLNQAMESLSDGSTP